MPRQLFAIVPAVLLCIGSMASAQQYADRDSRRDSERDQSWYYQQPTDYQPDARTIILQKAQQRGAQRSARLASMSWYGMSNSRPTAAPTPFTSLYSPVWQMPGGRPFAWYEAAWPTYVIVR